MSPNLRKCLTAADRLEAGRHEGHHAAADRGEVVGRALAVRQLVEPAGARHIVGHRAGQEVIAPEDLLFVAVGHGLFEQIDQREADRVEIVGHLLGTPAGGAVGLGADLADRRPVFAVVLVEFEVGIDPGVERALDRDIVAGLLGIAADRLQPAAGRGGYLARPYRLEDAFLAVEMIMDQRRTDPDARRDLLQRDAVIAIFREQLLRRVEDTLDRRLARALLVLPRGRRDGFRPGFSLAHRIERARPCQTRQRRAPLVCFSFAETNYSTHIRRAHRGYAGAGWRSGC